MDCQPDPGDRRRAEPARPELDRPPGDRYREAEEPAAGRQVPGAASTARAGGSAILFTLLGAALIVVLGGVLALGAGLLVVASLIGWAVGRSLATGPAPRRTTLPRRSIAVGLAVASIALGQVGLWLYAASLGGALPLVDYLAQTRGLLVPLEAAVAAAAAWWSTR